ncbi:TrkA C-terminal domain-containing protein [Vulcanisaeta distributa]|uniref:TrkA C-terminal domain-containing protein n=1 Tax=Vulcanisaeta distributa TaxID=164451 RepID=UPI001FB481DB|nr:TrkA C-terminal domain-containing protein [Vulcanisaeta distributa]
MEASEYVGRRFMEVMQLVKSRLNYLVIGVIRGGEVILNPGNDFVIQPGDSLLVIK